MTTEWNALIAIHLVSGKQNNEEKTAGKVKLYPVRSATAIEETTATTHWVNASAYQRKSIETNELMLTRKDNLSHLSEDHPRR